MSKAWGWCTSDKYLTEHCGMLKNLRPGDLVMAERGFTIEENLSLYQAKLAIPAFTKRKKPVGFHLCGKDERNRQRTYTCRKGDWFVETEIQCITEYITY